jgi:GNAT superfamily N-acetyltransferase
MNYTIRSIQLFEFKKIYKMIKHDFVPGEYAPYGILYHQLQDGILKGYILLEGDCEVAYSICTEVQTNDYILLSFLAVYEGMRGRGIGTGFLEKLSAMYSDKNGIIVEVEKPENAKTNGEKDIRQKRIHFYQKAGFSLLSDIEYTIWDMPMHLMTLPLKASSGIINKNIGKIIYDIYLSLMGERYINKMKIVSLK